MGTFLVTTSPPVSRCVNPCKIKASSLAKRRAYYFAFYVIERWVDPSYKFSGLGHFLTYLWRSRK